ncbi:hypothetical protein D9M72_549350 [compost metagenome]
MEEKLRQSIVQKVCACGQLLFLGGAGAQHDLAALAGIKLLRLEGADMGQSFGDQRLQVGEADLGVGPGRHLGTRQAGGNALGEVCGDLYLTYQRKHVREQPRLQQRIGIDIFLRRLVFGLLEHVGQGAQHLLHDGNGGVVQRAGHGEFTSKILGTMAGVGVAEALPTMQG